MIDVQGARFTQGVLDLFQDDLIAFKNVTEFALLATQRKRVVRLVGKEALAARVDALASLNGLTFQRGSHRLRTIFSTTTNDRFQVSEPGPARPDDELVMFIGRGEAPFEARALEEGSYSDSAAASLYGYPCCCAKSYARVAARESWIRVYFEGATEVRYSYLGNKVGSIVTPCLSLLQDYFPCSPACTESMQAATMAEAALKEVGLQEFVPLIREHLTALCLLIGDVLLHIPKFSYRQGLEVWTDFVGTTRIDLSENATPVLRPQRITLHDGHVGVEFESGIRRFANGRDGNCFVQFS